MLFSFFLFFVGPGGGEKLLSSLRRRCIVGIINTDQLYTTTAFIRYNGGPPQQLMGSMPLQGSELSRRIAAEMVTSRKLQLDERDFANDSPHVMCPISVQFTVLHISSIKKSVFDNHRENLPILRVRYRESDTPFAEFFITIMR